MMERVSDEWLEEKVCLYEHSMKTAGNAIERQFGPSTRWCMLALKELQERRRAEKEQMELQYFTLGVVENGRLYMDIPTGDKKTVETILESVKPIPVKRCQIDGVEQDVKEWTIKQWFAKINEELDEMKEAVYGSLRGDADSSKEFKYMYDTEIELIVEEAMDTITAIISFLDAMGIDEEQRNEAQRLVNEKNRKRGRL